MSKNQRSSSQAQRPRRSLFLDIPVPVHFDIDSDPEDLEASGHTPSVSSKRPRHGPTSPPSPDDPKRLRPYDSPPQTPPSRAVGAAMQQPKSPTKRGIQTFLGSDDSPLPTFSTVMKDTESSPPPTSPIQTMKWQSMWRKTNVTITPPISYDRPVLDPLKSTINLFDLAWRTSPNGPKLRPQTNPSTKAPTSAATKLHRAQRIDTLIVSRNLLAQHAPLVAEMLHGVQLDLNDRADKKLVEIFEPGVLGYGLPEQLQSEKDAEYYVQTLHMQPAKAILQRWYKSKVAAQRRDIRTGFGSEKEIRVPNLHSSSAKGYTGVTPDGLLSDLKDGDLNVLVVIEVKTPALFGRSSQDLGIFAPLYDGDAEIAESAVMLNWIVNVERKVAYYLAFAIIQVVMGMIVLKREWGVITSLEVTIFFYLPEGEGKTLWISPPYLNKDDAVVFWYVCAMMAALKIEGLESTNVPDADRAKAWWDSEEIDKNAERKVEGIPVATLPRSRRQRRERGLQSSN